MFDFAKEIHKYCKADVQLFKSGCIKFINDFIKETDIDPFQSCTIECACMNVLHTSHVKPNSIRPVLVNGYRSLRTHSNNSMEWITAKTITGVSYSHAWSVGGDMYLKKAKVWEDAYYKSPRHDLHGMTFPWMSDVF